MVYSEDILQKMERLLLANKGRYWGCAETTFAIISETLGLKGRDPVTKSMVGLSGGIANFGTGSCGAIAGAAAAISLSFNTVPLRTERGLTQRDKLFDVIAEVVTPFMKKYGGLSCREVLMTTFGKSFNFRDPERLKEFWAMDRKEVTVIEDVVRWTVEAILKAQPEGVKLMQGGKENDARIF